MYSKKNCYQNGICFLCEFQHTNIIRSDEIFIVLSLHALEKKQQNLLIRNKYIYKSKFGMKKRNNDMNLFPCKFFCTGVGEVGMRGFFHDETSKRDRIFHGGNTRYSTTSSLGTIHNTSLHFHRSFCCQSRSTARIEKWICF